MSKTENTLTIINRDADKFACRIALAGEIHLSSSEIRDLLQVVRTNDAAGNFIVDFGKGHVVTGSATGFGVLERELTREMLLSARNSAMFDARPALVPNPTDASDEDAELFWPSTKGNKNV